MVTNESILEFEMAGLPIGQYIAYFRDVQPTQHPQWGKGVQFVFEVATGEYKGQMITRICKPTPTRANLTGKLLAGITGKTLGDEKISIREFIDKPYNILVEFNENNKAVVAKVWPYHRPAEQRLPQNTARPIQHIPQPQPQPQPSQEPAFLDDFPPDQGDEIPF